MWLPKHGNPSGLLECTLSLPSKLFFQSKKPCKHEEFLSLIADLLMVETNGCV